MLYICAFVDKLVIMIKHYVHNIHIQCKQNNRLENPTHTHVYNIMYVAVQAQHWLIQMYNTYLRTINCQYSRTNVTIYYISSITCVGTHIR